MPTKTQIRRKQIRGRYRLMISGKTTSIEDLGMHVCTPGPLSEAKSVRLVAGQATGVGRGSRCYLNVGGRYSDRTRLNWANTDIQSADIVLPLEPALQLFDDDSENARSESELARTLQSMWFEKRINTSDFEVLIADPQIPENEVVDLEVGKVFWHVLRTRWTAKRNFSRKSLNESQLGQETLLDPAKLLERFEESIQTPVNRRKLALFAEALRFAADQQKAITEHLLRYVAEYRSTHDKEEIVAIGSAIRKLIAYLPNDEFDRLAALLTLEDGEPIAVELELELTKAIVYRLSWDPSTKSCQQLSNELQALGIYYSNKRTLQERLASSVASNAIIALALLGCESASNIVSQLPKSSTEWFIKLLRNRANRAWSSIKRLDSSNSGSVRQLEEIVGRLTK
jgi:hypothetical protein